MVVLVVVDADVVVNFFVAVSDFFFNFAILTGT